MQDHAFEGPIDWEDRDEKLAVLRHLLMRLASERTLRGALDALSLIPELCPEMAAFAVYAVPPADGETIMDLAACHGPMSNVLPTWEHGAGTLAHLDARDPLFCRCIDEDRELMTEFSGGPKAPRWAERAGIVALHTVPIRFRGHIEGMAVAFLLEVQDKGKGRHEEEWGRVVGDFLGAILATARAFDEIERLKAKLELECAYLRDEVMDSGAFGDILGSSQALQRVLEQVRLVANAEASVLILGESGTGKELVARAIHEAGPRNAHPLIRVNCASVPAELFESEFFGHVKGAFTGALRDRPGRFRLADGGTLFLDEVGEIPLSLQGKLLRVLQEGTFEAVGDARTRKVNVRVVAATNRDLRALVDEGRFREDLYYRLSVIPLEIPPLRKRIEDVPILAGHFVARACRTLRRPPLPLSDEIVAALQDYDWPGNVRELQNACERAVIVAREGRLDFSFLGRPAKASPAPAPSPDGRPLAPLREIIAEDEWERLQKENLERAVTRSHGRIEGPGGAASLLGLRPSTLRSRLRKAGIDLRRLPPVA